MQDAGDQELLARARAGDSAALARLLEQHQAQVHRFGMRMCRDAEDARDVLQDTLLAFARGVREFRGGSALSTWLFTIARSFCLQKRRKRRGAPSEVESLDAAAGQVPAPGAAADEALAAKEMEQRSHG